MKKRFLILIILNLIFVTINYAQNLSKADTLKLLISEGKKDANQIKNLLKLGDQYEYSTPDTALFYYNQALSLSEKNSEIKLKAKSLYYIGIIYKRKGDYSKALEYYQESLEIYTVIDDKNGIARIWGNMALVYEAQSDYIKAVKYHQKALKFYEDNNNKYYTAVVLGNIGIVYRKQSNAVKALEYYQKSLKIYTEIDKKSGVATVLGNIGLIYADLLDYNKALEYYNKAINIYEEIDNKIGVARNWGNIGIVYTDKEDYTKALEYCQKALVFYEENGDKNSIAINLGSIANLYNKKGDYKTAIIYANKSLNIANEIGALNNKKQNYAYLSDAYLGLNNYKRSLEYKQLWASLKDSIFNIEKAEAIEDISTRYETEKKEKQIIQQQAELERSKLETAKEKAEREKKETQRNMFVIAFVLIIITGFFAFRSYKQKKESNILLAEQKLLRSQMNPHFISNALGSIQQFVLANNPIEGARYLSKFTSLMRNIIESSRNENVSVETELVTLDSYLSLQQLRFKNKFDFVINIDDEIEQEETLIPPMLAQPIIENSIKHAFKSIDYKGLIELDFNIGNEEKLTLKITDNGLGINRNKTDKEDNHISYATQIIKERINNLNKNNKAKYLFSIKNRMEIDNTSGTIAIFDLPLKYL